MKAAQRVLAAGEFRERAAVHRRDRGLRAPTELSGGRDRLLAEVSERVKAALEQLAGDGQAGAIAAESLRCLEVVVVVGRGGPARALRGLEQRPAQRGWSLARQSPG